MALGCSFAVDCPRRAGRSVPRAAARFLGPADAAEAAPSPVRFDAPLAFLLPAFVAPDVFAAAAALLVLFAVVGVEPERRVLAFARLASPEPGFDLDAGFAFFAGTVPSLPTAASLPTADRAPRARTFGASTLILGTSISGGNASAGSHLNSTNPV